MTPPMPRYVSEYYEALRGLEQQGARTEGALRVAFHTLLAEAGKSRGLTVLGEQTVQLANKKQIRFDGELKDQYKIRRGVWEAKDSGDDLDAEIARKIAAGYPTKNILFENTRRAVLIQNGERVLDVPMADRASLQRLLDAFLDYTEPLIEEFHRAVATFRQEIPQLAQGLTEIIAREKRENAKFLAALEGFLALCRASLNPQTSLAAVEDMLKQHLLTERIFRSVFNNPDFVRRNAIARELEKVVAALTSRSFSRPAFTARLDYFYRAIEETARTIDDYSEKQGFLHAVYEQFFQGYSTDTADTHGIVYTPAPIVRWMVASVEQVLQQEFSLSLNERGVQVLDPCVGTGTFILELLAQLSPSALAQKYAHELHCNEVLLLPYYIAAQNIEHEFFERTGEYHPFEGICFADTLDMGAHRQLNIFAPENTERIHRQEAAPIFVILGNPPYNVGQSNENDNNKNRAYPGVDKRIQQTYVKGSRATLNAQLYDMYVRFFRWATDRLHNGDGIVCFVSNNSFLHQFTFDGMRKELLKEFTRIYTLDLGGNIRKNPKLSGTTPD
ncbi:MAG: N-6 DNA methylase [Ardenticatenales bacterium]|nr:N-6 DNA methylase [Ardenticatenales bacterium]